MSQHYFPDEILIEIFTKLPVKTLIRFTLVSKSWNSLIKTSNFISKYLESQNRKNMPNYLLLRHFNSDDKKEHYTLHPDDQYSAHKSAEEIIFPLKSRANSRFLRIVDSCNGLICLCDDQFGTFLEKPIILFNPSIQKSLILPLPNIHPRSRDYVLGFGFDLKKFDYKVLRIVYGDNAKAEVYSLSKRSWGNVKLIDDIQCKPICYWRSAYYDGVVHWIAYSKNGLGNLILGFDFKDEEFRQIMLPNDLACAHAGRTHVNVHEDGLAIIKYNDLTRSCSIWVMKEYGVVRSWKKMYDVDLVEGMDEVNGFRKNGEVLVKMLVNDKPIPCHLKRGVVVSYDPKSRLIKDLGILGWLQSLYVDNNYIETLALL